jgi:hypothetical protein
VEIGLGGQGTRMKQRLSVHQAKATKNRIRVGTKMDDVVGEACRMVSRAPDVHSAHSLSQLLVTHMRVFIYIVTSTRGPSLIIVGSGSDDWILLAAQ